MSCDRELGPGIGRPELQGSGAQIREGKTPTGEKEGPHLASKYRTLDVDALRSELAMTLFCEESPGLERLGLTVELLPVRRPIGAPPGTPPVRVSLSGSQEEPGTLEVLALFALENNLEVVPPGEEVPGDEARSDRGRFHFGLGGQLAYSTALYASPRLAFEECARALDKLRPFMLRSGIELLSCATDPWPEGEPRFLQDGSPLARCLDQAFGAREVGRRALRDDCGIRVRLGFGGPVKAGLRWRAAQLLAPLATAAFAASPIEDLRHQGHKSTRARDWRLGEPSRTGFPSSFGEQPHGEPVGHYLDFALGARLISLPGADGPVPLSRVLSFEHWAEHGINGEFPDLEDWRRHLATLTPEVRPAGGLQLRSADTLGRAFWSVPLTFWSALLGDTEALVAVEERLGSTAPDLRDRWELAARTGLSDPDLGADVRWAFATAAEALLRLPAGWVSNEMLAAFVAFGERFIQRNCAPADEVLDVFLECGRLGCDEWQALEQRWCRVAGTPERDLRSIALES